MFTLRLFGGLLLEHGTPELSGRAIQRRRLLLLAVLALSPDRRASRDRLISILWPESTDEEARRRLSTALYDMRQLLGDAAIAGQGDTLRLDPEVVQVDVEEFSGAVREERWEDAERLYRGPLLDGIHLEASAEFEDWLDGHRSQLQRTLVTVLDSLARSQEALGDAHAAVQSRARLAQLEPYSGRWARELMRLQATLGDRAGALLHAARFLTRLRDEMGIGDAEVEHLAEELRRGPSSRLEPRADSAAPLVREAASTLAAATDTVAVSGRSRWLVVPLALTALLAAALLVTKARPEGTPDLPGATRVMVLPFRVTGDSAARFLEAGLVDLLSADLEGVGAFMAIDPHAVIALVRQDSAVGARAQSRTLAVRGGAARYVVGTAFGFGDSVSITAALHDAESGRLLREFRVSGGLAEVPRMVDAITARLAAGEFGTPGHRIASVAALTTLSIPALREFLAGEAHFRQGRFGPALESYRRAVRADSSFALAHYRAALTVLWGNAPGASTDDHDSLARRHVGRLAPRDRLLVEAYLAWRSGAADSARLLYQNIVDRFPDDVEATYQLGETLFHYSPQLGHPIAHARPTLLRVVQLDPSHWGARWHLALLDAHEGRPTRLKQEVRELLALRPDSVSALEMQLVGDVGPAGGPPPLPGAADELVLFGAAWRRAVFLHDLDGAERLLRVMADANRSPYSRIMASAALDQLDLARGQWGNSEAPWRLPSHLGLPSGLEHRVLAALTPGFERPEAERATLEAELTRWRAGVSADLPRFPTFDGITRFLEVMLKVARGDRSGVDATARLLDTLTMAAADRRQLDTRAATLRAYAAYREGNDAKALQLLTGRRLVSWYGLAVTSIGQSRSFERFFEAELLRRMGRAVEALGWFGTLEEHAIHDLVFAVPALLRSAELNERLGRPALAAEQFGRAAALWSEADSASLAQLGRHIRPIPR